MHQYISGNVIRGEAVGKKLGYPTANLDRRFFARHLVPSGVYACKVKVKSQKSKVKSKERKGVAVIGMKDTVRGGKKVEVYILDFQEEIYGWLVEAELVQKIRPLRTYSSRKKLIAQIRLDIKSAQKVFLNSQEH